MREQHLPPENKRNLQVFYRLPRLTLHHQLAGDIWLLEPSLLCDEKIARRRPYDALWYADIEPLEA
jgi:hypothetical protein